MNAANERLSQLLDEYVVDASRLRRCFEGRLRRNPVCEGAVERLQNLPAGVLVSAAEAATAYDLSDEDLQKLASGVQPVHVRVTFERPTDSVALGCRGSPLK